MGNRIPPLRMLNKRLGQFSCYGIRARSLRSGAFSWDLFTAHAVSNLSLLRLGDPTIFLKRISAVSEKLGGALHAELF
jgi:hypothetical protein